VPVTVYCEVAGFFREDLTTLFDLLRQKKIRPLVARRFPLAEARRAHELLGTEGVTGKIVLLCSGSMRAAGTG
jgi:NADPH2:quinone reductase